MNDFNKLQAAAKLLHRQSGEALGTNGGRFGTIFTAKLKGRTLEPFYSPLMSEHRKASDLSLALISDGINKVLTPCGDKAHMLYKRLFDTVLTSQKKSGIWTFWHYISLTIIVSHAYGELIEQGVVKNLDLADSNNWINPNWVHGVIMINFVAGKLYEAQLICFKNAMDSLPDLNVVVTYLTHKLNDK